MTQKLFAFDTCYNLLILCELNPKPVRNYGMKKMFIFIISCLILTNLIGQKNLNDSISQSRNRLTKNAMLVLGGWSVANIASGFIIAGQTTGETKYAFRMNGYWNIFNLGLAGLGYAGVRRAMLKRNDFSTNLTSQQTVEKLYAFNSGLDVAYIIGGFYLRERGNNQSSIDKQNQLKGYGTSIAIQGGFLLLLDAVMYQLHHKNTKRMNKKLEQLELNAGPTGLGISLKL